MNDTEEKLMNRLNNILENDLEAINVKIFGARNQKSIEIMIEYFIEVPNTNIKEPVTGFAYDLLYDMAQEYGHAQLVWYALNGKRVVEGEYTDQD